MNVVECHKISKAFGNVQAIKGINFFAKKGKINALLGHNGAGKTTTLRAILGLLRVDLGEISVLGKDIYNNPEVRRSIGYLGETHGFYLNLSVKNNLLTFAKLKLGDKVNEEVERVIELFELSEVQEKKFKTLSAGNKQRVALARAFLGTPEILILDEPSSNLDPVWTVRLRKMLKDQNSSKTTIISSHILGEVEKVADEVTILRRGEVVFEGTMKAVLEKSTLEELYLEVYDMKGEKNA